MHGISDPPFDSVHYAVWSAANAYEGGDYHGFYPMLPHHRFGMLLGDVPESGENGTETSGNMLVYVNHVLEEEIEESEKTGHIVDPRRCMEKLNRKILADDSFDAGMYPAMFSTFNTNTGTLKIVNAGQPNPIIVPRRGKARIEDSHGQLPLGIYDESYHYHRTVLKPGDRIFCFTDGVNEAGMRNSEAIDMDHVLDEAGKTRKMPFDEAIEQLGRYVKKYAIKHSNTFVNDTPQLEDDITLSGFAFCKRSKAA